MQPTLLHSVLFLSLLHLVSAWGQSGGQYLGNPAGKLRHRGIDEVDSFHDISLPLGLEARANLGRRQDDTCTCIERPDVFYDMTLTSSYMATPFGECNPIATTSNLCPTSFICACQVNATSICLPITAQGTATCNTPYSGATVQPTATRWFYSTAPSDLAAQSGQCGGTVQASATTFWAPSMTLCPVQQACSCQSSGGYSICVDSTVSGFRGTACPNPCGTVRQEFSVSLPPPSATAKLGGQCGGRCWSGPTNCPTGASCFTETSPVSGAYAACATSNPGSQLKVRVNDWDEGINVPVKARAIATRIYF